MRLRATLSCVLISVLAGPARAAEVSKVVLVACPSATVDHHHLDSATQLARALRQAARLNAVVSQGWPRAEVLAGAQAIVLYCDGGERHPALVPEQSRALQARLDAGAGLVALHGAVVFPPGAADRARAWLGGFVEVQAASALRVSWPAPFPRFPVHPVTRGVVPFTFEDRWPPAVELAAGAPGVTVLLSAIPPEVARARANRSPVVAAWAFERPGGGRSFAMTGGHYPDAWADQNLRRLVVNAILWTARLEVPVEGAPVALRRAR
jgi:hypothetical protein